jgi:hypothetical protein
MLTTSYFASKAPAERKVCIALKRPRFLRKGALWIKDLAPSNPWAEDWQGCYRRDLESRFPGGKGLSELLHAIEEQVPDAVLCCYEKSREECHRGILAEYAANNCGFEITEWMTSN